MFDYVLVNEQGSTTIVTADLPELQVSINGGAWQTLAAAGLTLSIVGGKLRVSGHTNGNARRYRFEDNGVEPYSAADTVVTADTTGTSIKALWARHATQARPALGLVTANFMPGIQIVPTPPGQPVVAA